MRSSTSAQQSQPPAPTKKKRQHEADDRHQNDDGRISPPPAELRHVGEVHAVEPDDDRPGNRDRAAGGHLADEAVQLCCHARLEQVDHLLEVLTLEVGGVLEMAEALSELPDSAQI